MSASVTVAAPAKINLHLGVGPLRPDGFHALATVYQAIGLYDEVTVAAAGTTTLSVSGEGVAVAGVPVDPANLALRAAALLAAHAGIPAADAAVAMSIHKRIPVAGGMAGGSTDAAAALVACDALWQLHTPREELLRLAAQLGSDVPFCLVGGTATGSGRGEVVHPVEDAGSYWWVVATSDRGLATPAVFAEHDRRTGELDGPTGEHDCSTEPRVPEALLAALTEGNRETVGRLLANDLQPAALALRPDLARVLELGGRPPAIGRLLSGSGPTCLFLAADEPDARRVREVLRADGVTALVAHGPAPGARLLPAL